MTLGWSARQRPVALHSLLQGSVVEHGVADMHKMARQGTHAKTRRYHRVQVVEATKMVSISPYNHQLGFFGMK
jgi:hypothetical protein